MVLVSHKYKFIYLKNYKVAGSSVEAFFGQFCIDPSKRSSYSFEDSRDVEISEYGILGSRHGIYQQKIPTNQIWNNHKSAFDIKNELGEDIFNKYIKFCVIRNPYDVMVSSYYWDIYLKRVSYDFKTYCKNYNELLEKNPIIKYNRNHLNKLFIDNQPVCQYYIRYENLENDIIMVLSKLGITDYNIMDLPKHKSGIRPLYSPYQSLYDEESKEIVYQIFKTECDMFHYVF